MPDIAVVVVTYRSAQLTIDALRSVEAERMTSRLGVRAIVVDNDSGDLPVIAAAAQQNGWLSWVTLVNAPRNGGFAYGNNLGIARAYTQRTPDYIYLLNPDTQVRPGAIATLVGFLNDRPDVGIAGSSFENLDGSAWPIAFRFPTIFSELDTGLQWGVISRLLKRWVVARVMTGTPEPVDWICGASMMIRPTVLASIGGMDENYFLYFEETDFCRRARCAGHSTWYVPSSRVMHIMGQSTSVTDTRQGPRRLPGYWFESRRRYYVLAFGLWRAAAIDLVALLANSIGHLKRVLQGKRGAGVPHFIRDLFRHSVLWPSNRAISTPSTRYQSHRSDSPTA
ncbi:MAG TPA: glycosyltransferase family 2 protein [Steroidobacteraceae bacterium]